MLSQHLKTSHLVSNKGLIPLTEELFGENADKIGGMTIMTGEEGLK